MYPVYRREHGALRKLSVFAHVFGIEIPDQVARGQAPVSQARECVPLVFDSFRGVYLFPPFTWHRLPLPVLSIVYSVFFRNVHFVGYPHPAGLKTKIKFFLVADLRRSRYKNQHHEERENRIATTQTEARSLKSFGRILKETGHDRTRGFQGLRFDMLGF